MNNILKAGLIPAAVVTAGLISASNVSADTVTVKSGDTLNKLAEAYNTDVDTIVKDNNIKDANLIYVGDNLTIGTAASATQEKVQQPATVTVAPTTQYTQTEAQPVQTQPTTGSSAKETLAQRESGGSYTAQNGRYYGKYQLDSSYLNGDYSESNQDATAENYVHNRYGSWENALAHSNATGWY